MSELISDQKHKLRQKFTNIRNNLGEDHRYQASQAICNRIEAWDVYKNSKVILTYMPMRTEVNLLPLLKDFSEKRWLIPRILPEREGQMAIHVYDPEHLVQHKFGMSEPAPELPQISPGEVQLVLVPGLAFDRSGWRLGYGGGYYDRFLSIFKGVSAGIVFHALTFEKIPHAEYDIPVSWVINETEIFKME